MKRPGRGNLERVAGAKALRQKDGNMLKSLKESHCGNGKEKSGEE